MTLRRFATAALLLSAAACRRPVAPGAIDSAMAACIPRSTAILAGIDPAKLRASPLYAKLPAAFAAMLEQWRGATSLMIAFNGADLVAIARGPLAAPPAGSVAIERDLFVLRPAGAQFKPGRSGAPDLVEHAAALAAGSAAWIEARGAAPLALSGNWANLTRLLRDCDYAGISLRLDARAALSLVANGRTPESARHFEETLRAAITLAAAGSPPLRAVAITREDRAVRANGNFTWEEAARLIAAASP